MRYPKGFKVLKMKFQIQFVRIANMKQMYNHKNRKWEWGENPKWKFWKKQSGGALLLYTFKECDTCEKLVCIDSTPKGERYHKCLAV